MLATKNLNADFWATSKFVQGLDDWDNASSRLRIRQLKEAWVSMHSSRRKFVIEVGLTVL